MTSPATPEELAREFADLPWEKRRLMIVKSDRDAQTASRIVQAWRRGKFVGGPGVAGVGAGAGAGMFWGAGAAGAPALLVVAAAGAPALLVVAAGPPGWVLGAGVGGLVGLIAGLGWLWNRLKGEQEAQDLSRTVVASGVAEHLVFPAGPYQRDHLHVAHPRRAGVYLPYPRFHTLLMQDKATEAVQLLLDLGASRVKLESSEDAETVAKIFTPLFKLPGTANVKAERHGKTSIKVEIEGPGSSQPGADPAGYAWLEGEPGWHSVIEARLNHGVSRHGLSFEYSNDFGIDASIGAKAKKLKIAIGGEFERMRKRCGLGRRSSVPSPRKQEPARMM